MNSDARPNILLVFTDQQRFDTIRELGSSFEAETPAMDFLAQEGVTFDNCFCTAPVCSPSRSTMMTGLYPSQAGMPGNLYDPCPPMLPTIDTAGNYFRAAGYETIYHGKWHTLTCVPSPITFQDGKHHACSYMCILQAS